MTITQPFLDAINRALGKLYVPPPSTLRPVYDEKLDTNASQGDKPSPDSPWETAAIMRRLAQAYPECKVMFVENTNSMEPVVDGGDAVALFPIANSGEVKVGDVCTYGYNGMVVMHRVIKITPDGYARMKGDNNFFSDGEIPLSSLTHRLVAIAYGPKKAGD